MKILLLAKKFPFPLKEGEPIAINYLARSLTECGCSVDLLVLNTSKHYFEPTDFPDSENFFNEIHSVRVDNHIRLGAAIQSLIAGKSYILDRFLSDQFRVKLIELLKINRYDVVQFETIYMAHYLKDVKQHSNSLTSLRSHNVEHEIWRRVASTTKNWLKKWYLRNQNEHLRQFEIEHLNQFDALLAITSRDLEAFRNLEYVNSGIDAPVGIDLRDYLVDNQVVNEKNGIGFIGALDWMPNQDGVVWFLEKVWPNISSRMPSVKFHIAGKNTPNWLKEKSSESVIVHGEVPDAKSFIQQNPILVAPLFSGSGIKIKVLEGMALSRVVVTTSIGAEGIPVETGQHLLIADTAEAFEKHLNWCFENPDALGQMGQAARKFIRQHFDNLEIGRQVVNFYNQLINH